MFNKHKSMFIIIFIHKNLFFFQQFIHIILLSIIITMKIQSQNNVATLLQIPVLLLVFFFFLKVNTSSKWARLPSSPESFVLCATTFTHAQCLDSFTGGGGGRGGVNHSITLSSHWMQAYQWILEDRLLFQFKPIAVLNKNGLQITENVFYSVNI